MNTQLLRAVAKQIRQNPQYYDQDNLGRIVIENNKPLCKTPGCIAGWACALEGYTVTATKEGGLERIMAFKGGERPQDVLDAATQMLDLDWSAADALFDAEPEELWPDEVVREFYRYPEYTSERANVVADFLEGIADGAYKFAYDFEHWVAV